MSEFRRRLMAQVASDLNTLPAGCVRCEYLESTGEQWIDTEKVVYADEDLSLDFYFPEGRTDNNCIMGWRYSGDFTNTSQCYLNYYYSSTEYQVKLWYGIGATSSTSGVNIPIGVRVRSDISTKSKKIFIDGVAAGGIYDKTFTRAYDGEKGSVYNNYLFTLNNRGAALMVASTRIYEYSLKDHTGNYTQHLIPILDSNGTPCFYDTVTKKFHYNKGTGTFLYKIAE